MKNRTAIGIVCIILAVAVTFVVSPLVNNISDKKTEVVRFVADVSHGTEIKDTDVEIVKISNSALPEKVIKDKKTVVGKFATADIFKGDFATESKVTDNANTAYDADGKELYHITEPVLSFREVNELELVVNYTISIPLWFAGHQFPSANIPIEVTSILTEKF